MARSLPQGRISLSHTEREVVSGLFQFVATMRDKASDDPGLLKAIDDSIIEHVADALTLAEDVEFPARAEHDEEETNEEWIDVERTSRSFLEDMAPQAVVDAAAEFSVVLALSGTSNRKWPEGVVA